ncbi:MAG TPA: response regulator, partial [Steroidobacteraceae bacterium]
RILAVDDSAAMRQMVRVTLHAAGHDVSAATNGREALEAARQQQFDLVIADVNMPEMDGISLVKELRAMPCYQHIPILFLTTEGGPDRKLEGRAAGATGWMMKPFNPESLTATVAKVLK